MPWNIGILDAWNRKVTRLALMTLLCLLLYVVCCVD